MADGTKVRRTIAVLAAWLLAAMPLVASPQVRTEEYPLKAAFVFRFPQFVDWPPGVLQGAHTLDLCVAQPNPFNNSLRNLIRGESVRGLALRVREVSHASELPGCQTLFVSTDSDHGGELLKAATARPILTIGEEDRFLDAGGIIAMRIVDRKIRFDVDVAHAGRVGLRIDAQLLRLAASVRGGTP